MKTVFFLAISLLLVHQAKADELPAQSQWEYTQLQADAETSSETLQQRMDELGVDGWELVGVIARRDAAGSDTLLFKRLKTSDVTQSSISVEVEVIPGDGVLVSRGRKADVEKVIRVIEQISKQPAAIDDIHIEQPTKELIIIRGQKKTVERIVKEIHEKILPKK